MVKEFSVTLGRKEYKIAFDFGFGYGFYQLLPKFGIDLEDLSVLGKTPKEDEPVSPDELSKKLEVFAGILLAAHHYLCEQEGADTVLKNSSQAMKVLEQIPMEAIFEKFADSQETTIDPIVATSSAGKKKASKSATLPQGVLRRA